MCYTDKLYYPKIWTIYRINLSFSKYKQMGNGMRWHEWYQFCIQLSRGLNEYKYLYKVEILYGEKILNIRNIWILFILKIFEKINMYNFESSSRYINWQKVAKDYDSIEICPYLDERGLSRGIIHGMLLLAVLESTFR